MRRHVIISGTGRAGTSFLVQLLTHLGLDTGFSVEDINNGLDECSKAGLEYDVRNANAPYIVKSPFFCDYAGEVLSSSVIKIDHIFIPYRDIKSVAKSRIRVAIESKHAESLPVDEIPGGLWCTQESDQQEKILWEKLNKLLSEVSLSHAAVTLISFPKLAQDPLYCYRKLFPIIPQICVGKFKNIFLEVSHPEWIHHF
jgi:hypothetical protein